MTDNITLRRAVVEQVRETLEKSAVRFFSLAAYISPIESVNGVKPSRGREDVIAALVALDAALAEPDAKPEPATDEQVAEAYKASENDESYWLNYPDGWRDAERFHGITKEDK